MKKILCFIFALFFIVGCSNKEVELSNEEKILNTLNKIYEDNSGYIISLIEQEDTKLKVNLINASDAKSVVYDIESMEMLESKNIENNVSPNKINMHLNDKEVLIASIKKVLEYKKDASIIRVIPDFLSNFNEYNYLIAYNSDDSLVKYNFDLEKKNLKIIFEGKNMIGKTPSLELLIDALKKVEDEYIGCMLYSINYSDTSGSYSILLKDYENDYYVDIDSLGSYREVKSDKVKNDVDLINKYRNGEFVISEMIKELKLSSNEFINKLTLDTNDDIKFIVSISDGINTREESLEK